MITVGDRVKFISDTGVGIVRSIKNGIAQVEVDGFEIPAMIADIVAVDSAQEADVRRRIGPDTPTTRRTTTSNNAKLAEQYGKITIDDDFEDEPIDVLQMKRQYAAAQKFLTPNQAAPAPVVNEPPYKQTDYRVLLMFVPSKPNVAPEDADLDLYLVNDSTYEIFYSIGLQERLGYLSTLGCGKIEEDTKIKIHHFKRASLANIMNLEVSLLPCKSLNYTSQPVSQNNIELHPMKFVRANNFSENDYFDAQALTFTLADNSIK